MNQYAYRAGHSTETATLRVHNDIASALDNENIVALIMLDLSAAFNVINHVLLVERLHHVFGISGVALEWVKSYLKDRMQCVSVDRVHSSEIQIESGVPQGSVLGPLLYLIFTKPVGDICRRHGFFHHCYADDTQVYGLMRNSSDWESVSSKLQRCLIDIELWMTQNRLKLNKEKTELIIFTPTRRLIDHNQFTIRFGPDTIQAKTCVRNLGIHFDGMLSMEKHIDYTSKICFMYIHKISRIRNYLSEDACKAIILSLVISRFDYGNALLYGANQNCIDKLQKIQNIAARLVTWSRKRDHVTPILRSLHWLPVKFRSEYKWTA